MRTNPMKMFAWFSVALLLSVQLRAVDAPLNVKESYLKFTGHTPTHDFDGEAKEFSGTAQIDPKSPQVVTAATIDIKAANLTTFSAGRDRNMLAWLRTGDNPAITFQLTTVKATKGDPAAATKAQPADFSVGGNFTLNKATKPLDATAKGWREGKWLVVTGATKIDTTLYGLPGLGQLITAVNKMVDVEFRLVFDLPAELQLGAAAPPADKPAGPAPKPVEPAVPTPPSGQPKAGG